jgi:hypothetical protein
MFEVIERKDGDFSKKYEQRLIEYFRIFNEGGSALELSFAFLSHVGLKPVAGSNGQTFIAKWFSESADKTIEVLKSMPIDQEDLFVEDGIVSPQSENIDRHQAYAPVCDRSDMSVFVEALKRLGPVNNEKAIVTIAKPLLDRYSNPYIAAMEAQLGIFCAIASDKGVQALGAGVSCAATAACEFVLDGKISDAAGKKYFELFMKYLGVSSDLDLTGSIFDYVTALEIERELRQKRAT